MNWSVPRACTVDKVEISGARLWSVELREDALVRLCVGFCLLWNGLISRLNLEDGSGHSVVTVTVGKKTGDLRAIVTWEKTAAAISLSPVECEALMFFVLKTVRDGVAEVDHIDLEAHPAVFGEPSGTFVLKFPSAEVPVSPEEARRRLGL